MSRTLCVHMIQTIYTHLRIAGRGSKDLPGTFTSMQKNLSSSTSLNPIISIRAPPVYWIDVKLIQCTDTYKTQGHMKFRDSVWSSRMDHQFDPSTSAVDLDLPMRKPFPNGSCNRSNRAELVFNFLPSPFHIQTYEDDKGLFKISTIQVARRHEIRGNENTRASTLR